MKQYCPIHEDSELYDDTKECHTCGFGYQIAQLEGERVRLHLTSGDIVDGVLSEYDVDADVYTIESVLGCLTKYTASHVAYIEQAVDEELPF